VTGSTTGELGGGMLGDITSGAKILFAAGATISCNCLQILFATALCIVKIRSYVLKSVENRRERALKMKLRKVQCYLAHIGGKD
jgi:hypothetical protein